MKKRNFWMLLVCCMLLMISLIGCSNESDTIQTPAPNENNRMPIRIPELSYVLNENGTEYTVDGIGKFQGKKLVIPSQYQGLPVTEIGDIALAGVSTVETVKIPSTIRSIGTYAFSGCSNLEEIEFEEGVTTIGEFAFEYCEDLQRVNLPNSVTSLGAFAFWNCEELFDVKLGNGITEIPEGTFKNCERLGNVELGNAVKKIGKNAFEGCTKMGDVEGEIIYAGNWAVGGTENLTYGVLRKGTVGIACEAFMDTGLVSLFIPEGFLYINDMAFHSLPSLQTIYLPSTLLEIGKYAFTMCYNLNVSIELPDSLQRLGEGAFWRCKRILNVKFGTGLSEIPKLAFLGCSNMTSLVLPEGIIAIGDEAFRECYEITEISLPKSLASIGESALTGMNEIADFSYAGTLAEWELVQKGTSWFISYSAATLHCADGDIENDELTTD